MDIVEVLPYMVSVLTAVISGCVSYVVSRNSCKSELERLEKSNKHDLEKMMRQHEVDIENLKEAHRLEIEKMELEHKHALELANNAAQNEAASNALGSIFGMVCGIPSVQEQISKSFTESMKGK